MFALFGFSGGEVILILALTLILFLAKSLPGILHGLDQRAHDAGRRVGGIYGKTAAQALTPDNQTAELYDPEAFRQTSKKYRRIRNLARRCRIFCQRMRKRAWILIRLSPGFRKFPP